MTFLRAIARAERIWMAIIFFLDSARGKCSDSMFLEPVSTIRAFELGEAFELSGPANATGDACTGRCSGAADSSVRTRFARDFF
jgi:hypothetical protein